MGVFFSSFFFYEYPYYYSQLIFNDYGIKGLIHFGLPIGHYLFYDHFNSSIINSVKFNGKFVYSFDLFYLSYKWNQNSNEYVEFFSPHYFITLDISKEIEHWDMKDEDLLPMDGKSYYPINNFYWLSPIYDFFLKYNQQPSFSAKQKFFNYSTFYATSQILENYNNFFRVYGFDNNFLSTHYILYFNSPMRYTSRFLNDVYAYFFGFKNDLLFDFNFLIERGYLIPFSYKEDFGAHFFNCNGLFFDYIKDVDLKLYEKNYAFLIYSLFNSNSDFNLDNFIISDLSNIYKMNEHTYNFLGQDIKNFIFQNENNQYLNAKKLNSYEKLNLRSNLDYSSFFKRIDHAYSENLLLEYKFIFFNSNNCFSDFVFPSIKY